MFQEHLEEVFLAGLGSSGGSQGSVMYTITDICRGKGTVCVWSA